MRVRKLLRFGCLTDQRQAKDAKSLHLHGLQLSRSLRSSVCPKAAAESENDDGLARSPPFTPLTTSIRWPWLINSHSADVPTSCVHST